MSSLASSSAATSNGSVQSIDMTGAGQEIQNEEKSQNLESSQASTVVDEANEVPVSQPSIETPHTEDATSSCEQRRDRRRGWAQPIDINTDSIVALTVATLTAATFAAAGYLFYETVSDLKGP